MSTDDLIARARAAAQCHPSRVPGFSALLSELADEVDRLRAENAHEGCAPLSSAKRAAEAARRNYDAYMRVVAERDRWKERWQATVDDADAARAALGRVRGVLDGHPELIHTSWIRAALEGKS